ncbi:hypothetical protein [Pseudonocardia oroxyli]|uniref:hypothetical protein n=1 Tax=Pseudonocardia oroxyli TaxID=366584 RepID=UPI0015A1E413|nr:hypothetical protein [Pseudonocardia oroxyli]
MRVLLVIGLLTCLVVPFGVVALRSIPDPLVSALEAAGCRGTEYRYEERQDVVWLGVEVKDCVQEGQILDGRRVGEVVSAAAASSAGGCFDSLAVWSSGATAARPYEHDGALVLPPNESRHLESCERRPQGSTDGSVVAFALLPAAVACAGLATALLVGRTRLGLVILVRR